MHSALAQQTIWDHSGHSWALRIGPGTTVLGNSDKMAKMDLFCKCNSKRGWVTTTYMYIIPHVKYIHVHIHVRIFTCLFNVIIDYISVIHLLRQNILTWTYQICTPWTYLVILTEIWCDLAEQRNSENFKLLQIYKWSQIKIYVDIYVI